MKAESLLTVCLCLLACSYSFRGGLTRRLPSAVSKHFSSIPYNTKAYGNSNSNSNDSIGSNRGGDNENGLIKQIVQKMLTIGEKLRSKEWRDAFMKRIIRIATAARTNIAQDVSMLGNKSELWLPTIAQMLLVSFVALGVPGLIEWLFHVSGILSSLCGLVFLSMGLWNLGENITVFLTPVNGNRLVTHGIYGFVRHPIYSGLLLLCSGVAIQSGSVSKLLVSVALAILTDRLCDAEETLITDIHGHKAYSDYRSQVKKLIPYVY